MFESYLSDSILKRAQEAKKVNWFFYNPREESNDKWKRVDDRPYGGGPGMVMTPDPILRAVEKINKKIDNPEDPLNLSCYDARLKF